MSNEALDLRAAEASKEVRSGRIGEADGEKLHVPDSMVMTRTGRKVLRDRFQVLPGHLKVIQEHLKAIAEVVQLSSGRD
jgi:hypothetical protein